MIPFPEIKYSIIYADPPWRFKNKRTGGSMKSGAASQYDTMTVNEICALPVHEITNSDCVLFMWWVGSMPTEALKVVEAWGFKIKTMTGFTWIKKTKRLLDFFGMGFWTRQQTENCLVAVKGKPKRVCKSVRQNIRSVVCKHSEKPPEVRDLIVKLMGDLPRIELFARQRVDGWDAWGSEAPDKGGQ